MVRNLFKWNGDCIVVWCDIIGWVGDGISEKNFIWVEWVCCGCSIGSKYRSIIYYIGSCYGKYYFIMYR